MPEPSLEELIAAVANGDRHAFARLYEATSAKLFGVAVRILKRRDLAEEVLHDAFLRVWDHAGEYAPSKGTPLTWMISIVRHRAIDRLRSNRDELPINEALEREDWPARSPDPLDRAIGSAALRALKACLDELEGRQRECILLAYYEGYTHEEIAERLSIPLGTVKSWIRRGLLRIRDCLER